MLVVDCLDAQRDEFWTDKDKLIGMVAEVRADEVTEPKMVLQFTFSQDPKTFRGFAEGEKIQ